MVSSRSNAYCSFFQDSMRVVTGNLAYFKTWQSVKKVDAECIEEYTDVISKLYEEFDR